MIDFFDLNAILEEWKKDSVISDLNLDVETQTSAKLHAKYLELLTLARLSLKKHENKLADLKKEKWAYYNGKMTKSDMDDKGWKYDPYDSMSKPLKHEMSVFYDSDKELQKAYAKINFLKIIIQTLEEIIDNIRWRNSAIKNIIDWRKFVSGN